MNKENQNLSEIDKEKILKEFSHKISDQYDIPSDMILSNKDMWNLLDQDQE